MVSQVSGVYDGIILGAGHNGLVLQAYLLSGRLPAAKSVITGRFPERGITGDISRGCTYAGAAIREVISPAPRLQQRSNYSGRSRPARTVGAHFSAGVFESTMRSTRCDCGCRIVYNSA